VRLLTEGRTPEKVHRQTGIAKSTFAKPAEQSRGNRHPASLTNALDRLGIAWKQANSEHISVAPGDGGAAG
jgi:hypothetical protein